MQSLNKALDFFIELKFCKSDFYFLNRCKKCKVAIYNIVSVYIYQYTSPNENYEYSYMYPLNVLHKNVLVNYAKFINLNPIFNFQLVIDKQKACVRFGMMHIMATNLCVLLITAITETAEDYRHQDYLSKNTSKHFSAQLNQI